MYSDGLILINFCLHNRHLVNIIKGGKISIARTLRATPHDAPARYINSFVFSYNSHDLNEYKQRFLSLCTPQFKIIKRVYGKVDPLTGKPRNPFGNFSYLEINGINQVVYMAERFFNAAPDGVFETGTHRSCNTQKATVLVSTFKFRGTLIEETPTSHADSAHRPSGNSSTFAGTGTAGDTTGGDDSTQDGEAGELVPSAKRTRLNPAAERSSSGSPYTTESEDVSIAGTGGMGVFQTKPVHSVGSLAMYLNEEGKVSCLEFFYEYL